MSHVAYVPAAYPSLCLPMLSTSSYTSHTLKSLTIFSFLLPLQIHFCPWGCQVELLSKNKKDFSSSLGKFLRQSVFCSNNMCTGKCSRFIAVALYPLVLLSIICNIVLFFPDGDTKYAKDGHITEEVKYMGGVVGGGIMVSCPYWRMLLSDTGCCQFHSEVCAASETFLFLRYAVLYLVICFWWIVKSDWSELLMSLMQIDEVFLLNDWKPDFSSAL